MLVTLARGKGSMMFLLHGLDSVALVRIKVAVGLLDLRFHVFRIHVPFYTLIARPVPYIRRK